MDRSRLCGSPRPTKPRASSHQAEQVAESGWYESDESGRSEIYVQSYPGGTNRIPVSTGGGFLPTLHSVAAEQTTSTPITLVTNWPALLKKD